MSIYVNRAGEIREIDDTAYARWVADGNPKADDWKLAPPPPPAEPEPITEVPAWRIHAMLARAGLTNTVAGMLEALPEPAKFDAKAQFMFATVFKADNAFVMAAASKLGLSVQEFFQTALTVPGSDVADLTDPGLIDRIKAWWNT